LDKETESIWQLELWPKVALLEDMQIQSWSISDDDDSALLSQSGQVHRTHPIPDNTARTVPKQAIEYELLLATDSGSVSEIPN
jgi:hypothetical protein